MLAKQPETLNKTEGGFCDTKTRYFDSQRSNRGT